MFETTLGLNEHVCVGIQAIDDSILERSRTLTVKIQDAGLAQLTDPDEREIHERLNVVDPCCVTVTIDDNDGMFNNFKKHVMPAIVRFQFVA